MYGAINAGEKLLQTGTAKASNKFLVLASDFGGYKSDTGDGKGYHFSINTLMECKVLRPFTIIMILT